MGIWKQDGILDAGWFVETVSDLRNMVSSLRLMDNLAYEIDYQTCRFDTSSVQAFRDAACALARQKQNSLELQCWNLIDELDGREVRLAEEGMGKERFSVGSDEVISLLQISTDYSLDFIDLDRPIEVACACIARHPDYIPQVASAVRGNAQQIPEETTVFLMKSLCCGLQGQGDADPRKSLVDVAHKPRVSACKAG